jgi:hypothetical protein
MQSAPFEHPAARMLAQNKLHRPPRVAFASIDPLLNRISTRDSQSSRITPKLLKTKDRVPVYPRQILTRLGSLAFLLSPAPEVRQ